MYPKLPPIDKSLQSCEWGDRPLTEEQIKYAKLDPVLVMLLHKKLLQLAKTPKPEEENISELETRVAQLEEEFLKVSSELEFFKNRLKQAMDAQHRKWTKHYQLKKYVRVVQKVPFYELAKAAEKQKVKLDIPINYTEELKQLVKVEDAEITYLTQEFEKLMRKKSSTN